MNKLSVKPNHRTGQQIGALTANKYITWCVKKCKKKQNIATTMYNFFPKSSSQSILVIKEGLQTEKFAVFQMDSYVTRTQSQTVLIGGFGD